VLEAPGGHPGHGQVVWPSVKKQKKKKKKKKKSTWTAVFEHRAK